MSGKGDEEAERDAGGPTVKQAIARQPNGDWHVYEGGSLLAVLRHRPEDDWHAGERRAKDWLAALDAARARHAQGADDG